MKGIKGDESSRVQKSKEGQKSTHGAADVWSSLAGIGVDHVSLHGGMGLGGTRVQNNLWFRNEFEGETDLEGVCE